MTDTRDGLANGTALCRYEIFDGNVDDPSYAYCGHAANHAGDRGAWFDTEPTGSDAVAPA